MGDIVIKFSKYIPFGFKIPSYNLNGISTPAMTYLIQLQGVVSMCRRMQKTNIQAWFS